MLRYKSHFSKAYAKISEKLTLILTAYGLKDLFLETENSRGWLSTIYFLKIKNAFDVFHKQIFWAAEKAPTLPLYPNSSVQGRGSSGSFQPEAVSLVMVLKQ
jgi:hypothetical protein